MSKLITTDIVLIDIIDFSLLEMDEQLEIISYVSSTFRKMINSMLRASGFKMDDIFLGLIPTGDGFYSILDPKLRGFGPILGLSFTHFSSLIEQEFSYYKGIRVAVHTGNIYKFKDVLARENFVGDGLNECARYVGIKDLISNTVIISDKSFERFEIFLQNFPQYNELLAKCKFKRGSMHKIVDKHGFERLGYLIWMNQGAIIPPPKKLLKVR